MIDNPVVAELIKEEPAAITSTTKSEEWKAKHESQDLLQIVKCTDTACCSLFQKGSIPVTSSPSKLRQKKVASSEWVKDDMETILVVVSKSSIEC